MKNKKIIYKINKIIKVTLYVSLCVFSFITLFFVILSYNLDYTIPSISTIEIYDNDNHKILSYSNGKKKSYIPLADISPYAVDAFISIEDKRFFDHTGLDLIRIVGATINDIVQRDISQGASTITQQYARTLFLTNEKTLKRKLSEMLIALNLESKYSKKQILEGYLNSIYFDHGIYGIEDASIYYFNKSAKDLTLIEACSLASIPKGPVIYSPIKNPDNNKERREIILKELKNDNKINEEQYIEALNGKLTIYGKNPVNENESAPYFQDYVINQLEEIAIIKDKKDLGIKVYTTLDSNLNNIAIKSIANRIEDSEIEVALAAIEPSTGKIKTLIGGKNYQDSTYNRATNSLRQPGSSIKPFLYLSALENGFTVATTFKSEKTTFYLGKNTYSPTNYASIYPDQNISMVYAIAMSDNIYAVKTHLFIGMDKLQKTMEKFGLNTKIPELPSAALGTSEVSLLNFTECYQVLANLGEKITPYVIEKITDLNGEVIYEYQPKKNRVASKEDTYLLNDAMTNIFDINLTINMRPTGALIASRLTNKYAGKSGTTDTDNWMVGYDQNMLVSVWTGFDDNREITQRSDLICAKYIWADVIEGYYKDKNTTWYTKPDDVIGIDLNPITGFYPNFTEYSKLLYFYKGNIPWYIRLLKL